MASLSILIRPREFWSLKIELEWSFMKFREKNFTLLLVEILICNGLFFSKTQNMGQVNMSNYL